MDVPVSVFQGDLPIASKLERARGELLDLTARNRLLNVPRFSKAARTVEVVDERSSEIHRLLVREGKVFTFKPGRESSGDDALQEMEGDEEPGELPQPDEDEPVDEKGFASRHTDTKLQTRMASKTLQKRLLDLYVDARTLEEEQGVNILYLALGMLKWVDPVSVENIRHAPLILVPVRLERGAAGERFRLRARPEDLSANLSLEAYLDRVHKLTLPQVDPSDDFDAATYLDAVGESVSGKENWQVKPNDIVLGFFSFAKFLMYRDLDPANWPPGETIVDRPMIKSLLSEGFDAAEGMLDEDSRIDQHVAPAEMLHIVDCDSSQTLAVHDTRKGRDLVIQGPPGTGKSQTISNVIAAAVADGRTVLFVAEKMAALEVVKRRLDAAGVGDCCLELHSNKTNKRAVLEELRRTWDLGAPKGANPDALSRRLTEARDVLNGHVERLHRLHPATGLSPFQVFGHLARLKQDGLRPVDFELPDAPRWTPDAVAERESVLIDVAGRIDDIGLPDSHPWRGVGLDFVLPTTLDRLLSASADLLNALSEWERNRSHLAGLLRTEEPATLGAAAALTALGRRVASAPDLDPGALGGPHWIDRTADIVRLLSVGREHERLSNELHGRSSPNGLDRDVASAIETLSSLPAEFGKPNFEVVGSLRSSLPRLLEGADQIDQELGRAGEDRTLASLERMIATGERVAAAPDASPEAFAATVWDHGVEQAGDLAQAVATLEDIRAKLGDTITDAAWETDTKAARQALATHTGMLRKLNGEWRRAHALVRTVVRNPDVPLPELLERLDQLTKGQDAIRTIKEGDPFGRSAFGADWRSERSASAPLIALVDWMRTLRGLGAEPRLIAGRLPQRAELGRMTAELKALHGKVRGKLVLLKTEGGGGLPAVFGDGFSVERLPLTEANNRISALAEAHELASGIASGETTAAGFVEVLRLIMARQQAGVAIEQDHALGAAAFGRAWHAHASDWRALAQATHWIASNADIRELASSIADRVAVGEMAAWVDGEANDLLKRIEEVFLSLRSDAASLFGRANTSDVPTAELSVRVSGWLATGEQLSKWVAYRQRADRGCALGLTPLIERLRDGRLGPADTVPCFEMARFEALLADIVRAEPELGRFDGTLHGARALEFAALDRQRIAAASLEVVRAHHRGMPGQSGAGPVGVLRGEIARRRGHMPIRQLVQRAGPAIQALKPVLMMSPLSVAQFLTPGRMAFDLLVMDEASQIQPVDALGAIARCRQVVVVGDERQLPPSRFFARMVGGEAEDEEEGASVADIESILGLFIARGLPQRMLRWHYRSRHQSLIAVSNKQFYESKLFIVPSPYTREAGMGLSFTHVPEGVFESRTGGSGSGTNPIEAKLVAREVIRHAKATPGLSLGVATFSAAQRRAIQDELEVLRRLNPECEEFFHSHPGEPFFVKNLENVQGDERDVILISVGYGRGSNGIVSMRFGPLGAAGGERRLNVLISRAKRRCEVFSSITDEDIDLDRAKSTGVLALKLFLQYARTGRLDVARQSGRDADSVLEEQIARALAGRGYQVHPQVGIAGFFIDLAIADKDRPGRYLLGVECDGAAYHSSRSARDRDRLRKAVLEDHGWIIHRVWGSDWFQRPVEQLDRIVFAIEAAKIQLAEREGDGAALGRAVPVDVVTVEREDVTEVGLTEAADARSGSRPYDEAVLKVPLGQEMHELPSGMMSELAIRVVEVEGPVHVDEVVIRLRTAWGVGRAGSRIQAAVERAVELGVQRGRLVRDGAFLAVPGQQPTVRDRSAVASATLRKPEMLPPSEIDAAVMLTVRNGLGASTEEITAAVPRLFGFKAVSSVLRQSVMAGISRLTAGGQIVADAGVFIEAKASDGQ